MSDDARVVLLRGTSGSGKTHVAQEVIRRLGGLPSWEDQVKLGLRDKVGAYCWPAAGVAVMGRYESACGGCDGLSWRGASDDIERVLLAQVGLGRRVLLEGLIVATWGTERLRRITAGTDGGLLVLHLSTPLDVCLASVAARRAERAAARGREAEPLDPTNTAAKWRGVLMQTATQRAAGVRVESVTREEALARTCAVLGLSP